MQRMTIDEFHLALKAQGVSSPSDYAFICPMCQCVQSARDLIEAGVGEDFESVERYVGFSCVGRFTGASSPRRVHDGNPCDWTLGGLFSTHRLEVITEDEEVHPRFELATPEQAQALQRRHARAAA